MSDKDLQDWLKQRKTGEPRPGLNDDERAELARYDRLWEAAAPPDRKLDIDPDAAWAKVDERLFGGAKVRELPARRPRIWLRLAAAVLVLAVASFAIRSFLAGPAATTATTVTYATTTESLEVILPDGSRTQLNVASQLTYRGGAEGRRIELIGEAFFEVVRDTLRPFSITSGGLVTTVLGTSFNVRAYAGEPAEVSVKSGKVEVMTNEVAKQLIARQKVTYSPQNNELSEVAPTTVAADIWAAPTLEFNGATLAEIIPILERRFELEIEVSDPALLERKSRGDLGSDLEAVLSNLSFILAIDFERKPDGTLVIQEANPQ